MSAEQPLAEWERELLAAPIVEADLSRPYVDLTADDDEWVDWAEERRLQDAYRTAALLDDERSAGGEQR